MRYTALRQDLREFILFSLRDIKILEKRFSRTRLNEWQDKGYIKKISRGYYIFSDIELSEGALFEIANRIYSPSYISFETAFSYYGLIPESVYGITSASSRKTYRFRTPVAEFAYRKITPRVFWGYNLVQWDHRHFRIATPEKAILTFFFLARQDPISTTSKGSSTSAMQRNSKTS